MSRQLLTVFVVTLASSRQVAAQDASPRSRSRLLASEDSLLGFRLDTATVAHEWTSVASTSTEHAIYRRWAEYLVGRIARRTPSPEPHWSSAEQATTSSFDPGRQFVMRYLNPRVLRIIPTDSSGNVYRIDTVWTNSISPLDGVIETVYATRENDLWVFLGAININTQEWLHTVYGPIAYVYPRGHTFDSTRAAAALAFCDSVAQLFGVSGLQRLEYYMTNSADDALAIQGFNTYRKFPSRVGGYAGDHRIIVGDSSQGENYRHEFVHRILASLTRNGSTDVLVEEGVAVWLGGTKGMTFDSARRGLGAQLRAHPSVSLDSTLDPLEWNVGTMGAVLIQMVYQKGGISAVRALVGAGETTPRDRSFFEHALGMAWPEIKRAWRDAATAHTN
jgi:hypothetical protein